MSPKKLPIGMDLCNSGHAVWRLENKVLPRPKGLLQELQGSGRGWAALHTEADRNAHGSFTGRRCKLEVKDTLLTWSLPQSHTFTL